MPSVTPYHRNTNTPTDQDREHAVYRPNLLLKIQRLSREVGIPLYGIMNRIGLTSSAFYAWQERGIPSSRLQDLQTITQELLDIKATRPPNFDYREECRRAGVPHDEPSEALGFTKTQKAYQRWAQEGVPAHMRQPVLDAIEKVGELRQCRGEMVSAGYPTEKTRKNESSEITGTIPLKPTHRGWTMDTQTVQNLADQAFQSCSDGAPLITWKDAATTWRPALKAYARLLSADADKIRIRFHADRIQGLQGRSWSPNTIHLLAHALNDWSSPNLPIDQLVRDFREYFLTGRNHRASDHDVQKLRQIMTDTPNRDRIRMSSMLGVMTRRYEIDRGILPMYPTSTFNLGNDPHNIDPECRLMSAYANHVAATDQCMVEAGLISAPAFGIHPSLNTPESYSVVTVNNHRVVMEFDDMEQARAFVHEAMPPQMGPSAFSPQQAEHMLERAADAAKLQERIDAQNEAKRPAPSDTPGFNK
ncbi:hypothetical protein A4U49_04390 [Acidithiobacillus ferrivorans]|uniref:hypothetical protein n=1 Tax=Acidithiobacillus ferrivorans TaxID=160808 RepID=UPI000892CA44|nr:hypothetical protein [Acidithiobacillus ferrivorans]OFA17026.1 hypothetical protein A4U49_04390 [Acidithiobacillus ferrivorans]